MLIILELRRDRRSAHLQDDILGVLARNAAKLVKREPSLHEEHQHTAKQEPGNEEERAACQGDDGVGVDNSRRVCFKAHHFSPSHFDKMLGRRPETHHIVSTSTAMVPAKAARSEVSASPRCCSIFGLLKSESQITEYPDLK